jgi:NitT/TauT family transport system substrate-binding protein
MKHVYLRFGAAIVTVAGVALGASAISAAAELDKVHLQTDWIPSGEHAMYFAGWAKGFWKDEGIDINVTRGYGSGDTVTKVAAGAADFGVADIGAVLTAKQRTGVPVKTIMQLYTHSPHSLFVLKSSGITDFKGLEGKRISITPGNSHKLYFPAVAKKSGTDPDKIIWTNTDASAMAAMLIAKRIDAAPFYSMHYFYQNKAAMSAGEEIVVLPFEKVGFTIYSASIITSDKMLQEKPDLVKRFLRATQRAFKWANDNQLEACQLHVKKNPVVELDDCQGSMRATVKFVFNDHSKSTGLGQIDDARLAFTYENVATAQGLDANWDPHQAVDTSHVPTN